MKLLNEEKGIFYELNEMVSADKLKYELEENIAIDIYKSAGPSTCAIVAIDREHYKDLEELVEMSVNKLALLK